MNLAQIARILAGFTLFFSLVQVVPLLMAFYVDAPRDPLDMISASIDARRGFGISIGAGMLTSLLLWLAGRGASPQFFRKEGLVVVGAAWFVAGLLGAIPFKSSAAMPGAADAIFESISGLTTTGASVLGNETEIADLPRSLLFWRSLLQWIGGLGIILVFIVLLPAMGVTGKNLLSSEQIGVSNESLRPRMQHQARTLFRFYVITTLLAALTFWPITGSLFEGICHAFTTLSSGGFSTRNGSIGEFDSLGMEIAVIAFMFIAGCNFTLLLTCLRTGIAKPLEIFRNSEFRIYAILTVGLSIATAAAIYFLGTKDQGFGTSLRHASFGIVSILTSTGFGTDDFQTWPRVTHVLLIFCMVIGGCSGSTAGGIKMVRLQVIHKVALHHLHVFIRPKSVEKIRVDHNVIPNPVIASIVAMLILWMGTVALGTVILSLDARLHVFDCFAINVSMFGCTGPAIMAVEPTSPLAVNVGPAGNFGLLYDWQKLFLCFQMVLGRLELLVPLALVTPGFWKR